MAWLNLFFVTEFSIFDTIGRVLGGITMFMIRKKSLLIHVWGFGRLICVAFALYIMIAQLEKAWLSISNLAFFAFTNGYIMTLCCCYAPLNVQTTKDQDTIGNLIVLFITLGVSMGSIV